MIIAIEIKKENMNSFYRHAKNIARHLRVVDNEELSAALNCAPEDDVMKGYELSTRKWIILSIEGNLNVPTALFGVQDHGDGVGIPWMVATDGLKKIKRFLLESTDKYLSEIKKDYDMLVNYVDARNTDSIKWLKRLGFKFDEAAPYGHKQLPFHRFWMECK